jgi:hypothetical protein
MSAGDLPDLRLPQPRPGRRLVEHRKHGWPSSPNDDPADWTAEEDEFVRAVARFRSINKVSAPTLCQLLWVIQQLGYRKDVSKE